MTRLVWEERTYHIGVDRGVLYLPSPKPWNGLVSIEDEEADYEVLRTFVDGEQVDHKIRSGHFAAQVEAFTYPPELDDHPVFGLSYRTLVGDSDYQLHMVYNARVNPSVPSSTTMGDDIAPGLFGWELTTRPVDIPGVGRTAHVFADSSYAHPGQMEALEDRLYGTASTEPYLPHPTELIEIFEASSLVVIVDNGDGTWTASGSDELIGMLDPTTFEITSPTAIFIDGVTYNISTY